MWWWLHNFANVPKTTELYTLRRWPLWHINYISIELLKKLPQILNAHFDKCFYHTDTTAVLMYGLSWRSSREFSPEAFGDCGTQGPVAPSAPTPSQGKKGPSGLRELDAKRQRPRSLGGVQCSEGLVHKNTGQRGHEEEAGQGCIDLHLHPGTVAGGWTLSFLNIIS